MKSPNELNDFLKQKEQEFELPFDEKYWKQAEALLDQERRTGAAWWNLRNVGLSSLALLMGSMAVWYALSHQPVSQDSNSIVTNEQSAAPYFENQDNASVTSDNDVASNVVTVNSPVNSENSAVDNSSNNNLPANENVVNPTNSTDIAKAKTTTAKTTKSIPVNTTADNSISKPWDMSVVNRYNNSNLNSTQNAITPEQNLLDLKTDVTQIRNLNAPFITYRNRPEIPVFEQMTPDDQSLLKFYGLYYKSPGSTSKKIREFKYGAQYPQITFSAVGGLNVFNQVKQASDTNIYLGINPYLGAKVCYQWTPVMMLSLQPMLTQRGGIQLIYPNDSIQPANLYRHLYYLQVPATLGFKVSKKHMVYAGGGVSFLLSTGGYKRNIETNMNEGKYKLGSSKAFNNIDYFATLGYQYRLNKKISLQASFNYGFTDITSNVVSNQNHHNCQTSLGVTYQLYQNKLNLH